MVFWTFKAKEGVKTELGEEDDYNERAYTSDHLTDDQPRVGNIHMIALLADLKKSAYRIVVCNPHFAILQLFQRSGTKFF